MGNSPTSTLDTVGRGRLVLDGGRVTYFFAETECLNRGDEWEECSDVQDGGSSLGVVPSPVPLGQLLE